VGLGLRLKRLPIITTTWETWKKRHPQTKVLALDTGHDRDYGEGAAYRDYLKTQELMFPVCFMDSRLPNKQEIVALLIEGQAFAYDTDCLRKNPLYQDHLENRQVVILTDQSGASRIYDADGVIFSGWDRESKLTDNEKSSWQATENVLMSPSKDARLRIPSHRAFWFGWFAQFPNTLLVH